MKNDILEHMNKEMKNKIIEICDKKINQKGQNVGLSFYAFLKNKNTDPDLLLDLAKWWIHKHKFDHFEKAIKIKKIILTEI